MDHGIEVAGEDGLVLPVGPGSPGADSGVTMKDGSGVAQTRAMIRLIPELGDLRLKCLHPLLQPGGSWAPAWPETMTSGSRSRVTVLVFRTGNPRTTGINDAGPYQPGRGRWNATDCRTG